VLQKVRDILREKQDKGYPPFSEVIAKELNLKILKVKQELGYNSHSYSTKYLHTDSGIKFVINEYYSDEPPSSNCTSNL